MVVHEFLNTREEKLQLWKQGVQVQVLLFLSLSLSLCVSVSLCLCLSVSLSLTLFLSLSLSLPLSPPLNSIDNKTFWNWAMYIYFNVENKMQISNVRIATKTLFFRITCS